MHALIEKGTVIGGDFRILDELGTGGMGTVYRAIQISTGSQRALKVMHSRLSDDIKLRDRFTQEARVAAALESVHVVEIIGAGVDDNGVPWIAMEHLEGEDLAAYIKRIGPVSLGAAVPLLEQLCHGVAAAHDLGVVHRDLKPQNIFMAQSRSTANRRSVKVLDFGIAKLLADTTMHTTAALGSPAWMSPEQTDTKPHMTAAADVWPIGLLTFWMITGQPFWLAANTSEGSVQGVLREMVIEDIPSGSERARALGAHDRWPAVLDEWLTRCLARDPAHRFEHARAAYEALIGVLEGESLPPLEDEELHQDGDSGDSGDSGDAADQGVQEISERPPVTVIDQLDTTAAHRRHEARLRITGDTDETGDTEASGDLARDTGGTAATPSRGASSQSPSSDANQTEALATGGRPSTRNRSLGLVLGAVVLSAGVLGAGVLGSGGFAVDSRRANTSSSATALPAATGALGVAAPGETRAAATASSVSTVPSSPPSAAPSASTSQSTTPSSRPAVARRPAPAEPPPPAFNHRATKPRVKKASQIASRNCR
ncbi:MAG: serine/threonine-protein kinase, partial [Myxococcota bacterium]